MWSYSVLGDKKEFLSGDAYKLAQSKLNFPKYFRNRSSSFVMPRWLRDTANGSRPASVRMKQREIWERSPWIPLRFIQATLLTKLVIVGIRASPKLPSYVQWTKNG